MKEKESSRNRTLLMVIAVVALIVVVGGATFAFFASTQDINANLPANITTAGKTYTFIASANENIEFNLSSSEMSEASASTNVLKNDNANINVEVASANDGEITRCTYDIAWVWDSDNKYTSPDVELPYEKDGLTYPYELSVSVDGGEEKDLSTFTLDSNNSFIIATGLSSIATSTTPVIDSHKIEVKAYNIPIDQQNLFNKSFQAHMEVRNVNCDVTNGTITKLKNGTFYSALSNDVNSTTEFTDTDSTIYSGAIVNENGLRYEGKNPNNYVQFNDELWRIIGVFDENTHGRSGEQLVKLIRAESIGDYAWDENVNSAYDNNWNNASLKTTLNTSYYNSEGMAGIKTNTMRNMIQGVQWKIGGYNTSSIVASAMYERERGTILPTSSGVTAVTTEILPIGLMYPSDFGYAVQEDNCARTTNLYNYASIAACHMENWLFNSKDTWTITPTSGNSFYAWRVYSSGGIHNDYSVTGRLTTIPVLYLKQNVEITGGLGTISNPYTITM